MSAILACAAAVLVGLLVWTMVSDARDFKERFPPISDAEFLARCPPGTKPEVALMVRRIVAEHFVIEYDRVDPSMNFIEDVGAD